MTTTFILIRHGETMWNREGRLMGSTDIPLTSEGKIQSAKVARHLKSYPLDVIFCSPLTRTLQTARVIHRFHKRIPFIIHDKLRERDFGATEGLHYEEANARHPELIYGEAWKYLYFRPENGESLYEVQQRSSHFLSTILPTYESRQIAIVSHGTFLRVLACQLLNIPLTPFTELRMENTALTVLQQSKSQGTTLEIVNYTFHLTSTASF